MRLKDRPDAVLFKRSDKDFVSFEQHKQHLHEAFSVSESKESELKKVKKEFEDNHE
jgi:hypothetical protein